MEEPSQNEPIPDSIKVGWLAMENRKLQRSVNTLKKSNQSLLQQQRRDAETIERLRLKIEEQAERNAELNEKISAEYRQKKKDEQIASLQRGLQTATDRNTVLKKELSAAAARINQLTNEILPNA